MTNETVTGSSLNGYIVNVMRSPVIEMLMVRGSQVSLKHVIHDRYGSKDTGDGIASVRN